MDTVRKYRKEILIGATAVTVVALYSNTITSKEYGGSGRGSTSGPKWVPPTPRKQDEDDTPPGSGNPNPLPDDDEDEEDEEDEEDDDPRSGRRRFRPPNPFTSGMYKPQPQPQPEVSQPPPMTPFSGRGIFPPPIIFSFTFPYDIRIKFGPYRAENVGGLLTVMDKAWQDIWGQPLGDNFDIQKGMMYSCTGTTSEKLRHWGLGNATQSRAIVQILQTTYGEGVRSEADHVFFAKVESDYGKQAAVDDWLHTNDLVFGIIDKEFTSFAPGLPARKYTFHETVLMNDVEFIACVFSKLFILRPPSALTRIKMFFSKFGSDRMRVVHELISSDFFKLYRIIEKYAPNNITILPLLFTSIANIPYNERVYKSKLKIILSNGSERYYMSLPANGTSRYQKRVARYISKISIPKITGLNVRVFDGSSGIVIGSGKGGDVIMFTEEKRIGTVIVTWT